MLASLPGLILIGVGVALGTAGLIVLGTVGVIWLVAAAVVVSALSGIYRTALYHYAAHGEVPGEFSDIDFGQAFRRRGNRGNQGNPGGAFGSPSSN